MEELTRETKREETTSHDKRPGKVVGGPFNESLKNLIGERKLKLKSVVKEIAHISAPSWGWGILVVSQGGTVMGSPKSRCSKG